MPIVSSIVPGDSSPVHSTIPRAGFASNVRLDCGGHAVAGLGKQRRQGVGINVTRRGGTVTDCHVTGFAEGSYAGEVSRLDIRHSSANGNGEGFRIGATVGATLTDNTAIGNDSWGFVVQWTKKSKLVGNVANDNSIGFFMADAPRNVVKRNSAKGNRDFNYAVHGASSRNTLVRNVSTDGGRGFDIEGDRNEFRANRVTGSRGHGIALSKHADRNVLTANTVTGGTANGFNVRGVGNTLAGNTATDNNAVGIEDRTVPGTNSYTDNTCINNAAGASSPAGLCDDTVPVEPEPATQASDNADPEGEVTSEE